VELYREIETSLQWFASQGPAIIGAFTVLALILAVYERYVTKRHSKTARWLGVLIGTLSALLSFGVSLVRILSENLLSFIDTPREVFVVMACLVLILCSIVCTIYFRPARMTVIAGVALGFIVSVLFAEGIFAAQAYMNKRLEAEKKAVIRIRVPSTA
jgi:hypothetical protein